jgi:hypothetical protein
MTGKNKKQYDGVLLLAKRVDILSFSVPNNNLSTSSQAERGMQTTANLLPLQKRLSNFQSSICLLRMEDTIIRR